MTKFKQNFKSQRTFSFLHKKSQPSQKRFAQKEKKNSGCFHMYMNKKKMKIIFVLCVKFASPKKKNFFFSQMKFFSCKFDANVVGKEVFPHFKGPHKLMRRIRETLPEFINWKNRLTKIGGILFIPRGIKKALFNFIIIDFFLFFFVCWAEMMRKNIWKRRKKIKIKHTFLCCVVGTHLSSKGLSYI